GSGILLIIPRVVRQPDSQAIVPTTFYALDAAQTSVLMKPGFLHHTTVDHIARVIAEVEVVDLNANQGPQPPAQQVVLDVERGDGLLELIVIVLLPGLTVDHLVEGVLVIIEFLERL